MRTFKHAKDRGLILEDLLKGLDRGCMNKAADLVEAGEGYVDTESALLVMSYMVTYFNVAISYVAPDCPNVYIKLTILK